MNVIKNIYRLLRPKKTSSFVWEDLKRTMKRENYYHGVFENNKCIELQFNNNDDSIRTYFIYIYAESNTISCVTTIIETYNDDKTIDLFVLASHFNSRMNKGVVTINRESLNISYVVTGDLFSHSIYPKKSIVLIEHIYHISNDIRWAFNRLLSTDLDPVFVFSELLDRNSNSSEKDEV